MANAEININSLQLNIKDITKRETETAKILIKEKAKLVKMQLDLSIVEKHCKTNQYLADHVARQLDDVCDLIPQKVESIGKLLKEITDLHIENDHISDENFKANMVLTSENYQRRASANLMQEHLAKEQKLKDKQEEAAVMKLMKMSEDAIKMKKIELKNTKEELLNKIQSAKNAIEEKDKKLMELTNGMLPLRNRNRALMIRLRNQFKRSQEQKLDVSKRLDLLEQKFAEIQGNLSAIKKQ